MFQRFRWFVVCCLVVSCVYAGPIDVVEASEPVPAWAKTFIGKWRIAWVQSAKLGHVKQLQAFYHPQFYHSDAKKNKQQYMARLAKGAKKYAYWRVKIQNMRMVGYSLSHKTIAFLQHYERPGYKDVGTKYLLFRKHKGKWLIAVEYWRKLPTKKNVLRAQCHKQLQKAVKTSKMLQAYFSIPSRYFVFEGRRENKGRTLKQRMRWFVRCTKYTKACLPATLKGTLSYSPGCLSSGVVPGHTTFSFVSGRVPLAMIYMSTVYMNWRYTFLAKRAGAWRKISPPKGTKTMRKWMKKISRYPDGCPYSLNNYTVYSSSNKLVWTLGAGCNGDPPPSIKVGEYKWVNGHWKAMWLRKKKPVFYRKKGILYHR